MTSFTTSPYLLPSSPLLFFVTNFSVSSLQKVGKTKTACTVAKAAAMRISDQDQKGTWGGLVRAIRRS